MVSLTIFTPLSLRASHGLACCFLLIYLLTAKLSLAACKEDFKKLDDKGRTSLLQRARINRDTFDWLKENSPELSRRAETYLFTRYLIDNLQDELTQELYLRTQLSAKYSETAKFGLRFREWFNRFNSLTPFFRRRDLIFSDVLKVLGVRLEDPILSSLRDGVARIGEPVI